MYTCKDCLDYGIENKCLYPNLAKSVIHNSLAFHCEGFRGCETHSVIHRGVKVTQTANFNVWVINTETGKAKMHAIVTEYLSDDKLKEYADFALDKLSELGIMFNSEVKD